MRPPPPLFRLSLPFLVLFLQSLKTYSTFKGSDVEFRRHGDTWGLLAGTLWGMWTFLCSRREVSESEHPPSSFSGRLNISHHTCIGSCMNSEQLANMASCPYGRPSAPFGHRSSVCVSDAGVRWGGGGTACFPPQEKEASSLIGPDVPEDFNINKQRLPLETCVTYLFKTGV